MVEAERLSLQELTEAAGVPVRTVRYYIAEGLLPPPMGSGPASFYTANHLLRLRLIGRLKDAYLPLKEIRRRLEATPDGAVPGLLALEDAALADPATWQSTGAATRDDTLRYIDGVLGRHPPRPLREGPASFRVRPADAASPPFDAVGAAPPAARRASSAPRKGTGIAPAPVVDAVVPAAADVAEAAADATTERWRRIRLGQGAELLVGEEVYERLRGRVDWLVRQARRVFD